MKIGRGLTYFIDSLQGWHVATDAEWTTLTNALGGEQLAGGKLKESGQSHWNIPNTSVDNSIGFTGLPSGRREYADGTFLKFGFNTFWWTSTTMHGIDTLITMRLTSTALNFILLMGTLSGVLRIDTE